MYTIKISFWQTFIHLYKHNNLVVDFYNNFYDSYQNDETLSWLCQKTSDLNTEAWTRVVLLLDPLISYIKVTT